MNEGEAGRRGRVSAALAVVETALMGISAAAMIGIMLVVCLDVILRYFFSAPLAWSYGLIGLNLMVAAFFLALPDTMRDNGHIALDLFQGWIPTRLNHLVLGIGLAVSAVFVALVAWLGFGDALQAFTRNERILDAVAWPTWIPKAMLTLGTGTLALRCVHLSACHFASAWIGRSFVAAARHHELPEH